MAIMLNVFQVACSPTQSGESIYQLHETLSWHDNTSSERMDGNVSNMHCYRNCSFLSCISTDRGDLDSGFYTCPTYILPL